MNTDKEIKVTCEYSHFSLFSSVFISVHLWLIFR